MVSKKIARYCPKCGGLMLPDRDVYGAYDQCVICSYIMDLPDKPQVEAKPILRYERQR